MLRPEVLKYAAPYGGLTPQVGLSGHTVVFTHIPKAAGTTLDFILRGIAFAQRRAYRRIVGTIYGRGADSKNGEALANLAALPPEVLGECDYLTGHLPYGIHARLLRPCFYLTILRDPLERLLSHFRFRVRRGKWPTATPLEQLFRGGSFVDNPQTRQVAGMADAEVPCTPATLERAIANLRSSYGIVGTTERFDDAVKAMVTLFGCPDIAYSDRQVAPSERAPELTERIDREARRFLEFDLQLYAWAKARPVSWAPGVFAGVAGEPRRQETVLLGSELVRMPGSDYALIRRVEFDARLSPALAARGIRIRIA